MKGPLVLAILAIVVAIVALILAIALPGPAGPAGPEGPQGPAGVAGVAGVAGPEGSAGPSMIVAMGTVWSLTGGLSNPYNVASVTWNPDWQQWWISFTDIEYFVTDYVTIVTAMGDEYAGFSSQGDWLAVTLYDSNGAKTKGGGFSFVVLSAL